MFAQSVRWCLAAILLAAVQTVASRAANDPASSPAGSEDAIGFAEAVAPAALTAFAEPPRDVAAPRPPERRPAEPPRTPPRAAPYRLASVPNMFGDSMGLGGQVQIYDTYYMGEETVASVPLGGAFSRTKIAENNKALPVDRCFFLYNHFQNAITANSTSFFGPSESRSDPFDRFTAGFEKTFFDGCWSVEVRMPLSAGYSLNTSEFRAGAEGYGNLAVTLKRLIFQSEHAAAAVGLTFDTPTGSDATLRQGRLGSRFTLHNDALHLLPYVGFMTAPKDRLFFHSFVQVDVPTNGNQVEYNDGAKTNSLGTLADQTLLYFDTSAGFWFRRCPHSLLSGLAGVVECHYTTTLDNAQVLTYPGFTTLRFGNLYNRYDLVHVTAGVHAEIRDNTFVRIAGVFPVSDIAQRPFDSEIQVTLERQF